MRTEPIRFGAVLHDLNLAAKFCDRLLLIRQGRIVADGILETILYQTNKVITDRSRPEFRSTAHFLAVIRMIFLNCS